MTKRIFITGASGCIGHYVSEKLIKNKDHDLFLLVRNPDKLGFDYDARPGITVLQGDLREIEQFGDLLKTIDVAILIATSWGGKAESFDINVLKTIRLINLLDPQRCEQVIYFSTASILGRDNQLLKEAQQLGTDYISTKYECFVRLDKLAIAPKITTLFPTLVLGGAKDKPTSHLSSGIPEVVKWMNLIRWFQADGSFHFIHAQDIAQVVGYFVENPPQPRTTGEKEVVKQIVLGNQPITVNQAIKEICTYLGKRVYFRIPLYIWLANFFIAVFRVQMATWDRFCLNYRHFTYQETVNPATFGIQPHCDSIADILKVSGISENKS